MAIKISYKGYDFTFENYPAPAEVKDAYARLRSALQTRLAEPSYIPSVLENCGREVPMSFAQEWFWSLEQMTPGNPAYHLPVAAKLVGPLQPDVLERSLTEICRRHEVLRATFISVNGRPVQMLAPLRRFHVPLFDLSALPQSRRETARGILLGNESRRPFDLATGPTLRAMLIRESNEEHVIFLMLHHIAGDAWATGILIRELTTLYACFAIHRASTLPELRIQYAAFAEWQRRNLRDKTLERLVEYWKKQLAGAPPVLGGFGAKERPAVQSSRGAKLAFEFSKQLSEGLPAFSAKEGVTAFMTLFAGFCALLHRITGQQDIIVGSPISGRNRAEVDGLIGCFVNTLPIRVDLSGRPRFRELLCRVRQVALDAFDHQDLPFERIVEAIRPNRSLSHMPLYQVVFDFNNTPPIQQLESSGLRLSSVGVETGVAKLDLLVDILWGGSLLVGSMEYNTDLLETAEIQRFVQQFETLLHNAIEAPDRRVEALDLSTRSGRRVPIVDERRREILSREKFMNVRPRAIHLDLQ